MGRGVRGAPGHLTPRGTVTVTADVGVPTVVKGWGLVVTACGRHVVVFRTQLS